MKIPKGTEIRAWLDLTRSKTQFCDCASNRQVASYTCVPHSSSSTTWSYVKCMLYRQTLVYGPVVIDVRIWRQVSLWNVSAIILLNAPPTHDVYNFSARMGSYVITSRSVGRSTGGAAKYQQWPPIRTIPLYPHVYHHRSQESQRSRRHNTHTRLRWHLNTPLEVCIQASYPL